MFKNTRAPRLLHLFPSTIEGGAEYYSLTISAAAVEAGWDAHVSFPQAQGTYSLKTKFEDAGVKYHSLEIKEIGPRKLGALRVFTPKFIRTLILLLRIRPDVVAINLTSPVFCFPSMMACAILNIPTCVVFHLIAYPLKLAPKRIGKYNWARSRNQQWIAVSQQNCDLVAQTFHCPREAIKCIYTGVNFQSSSYPKSEKDLARDNLREKLNLPLNSRIILTVGRLHSQKGHADMIPVISKISKKFSDVFFVWAGEGELREALSEAISKYGIQDKVYLLGQCSNIPSLLEASDLFIFPSHYEGCPFSLLEAMSFGLPVVSSNASGIPELIKNQSNGLLFEVGDSCDLLEALNWALENPERMQEMAVKAQDSVREFSQEKMISKTLDVYDSLLLS